MKSLFLSVFKNIGRFLLVSFFCIIIGCLGFRYFFSKTQPVEFICGGNLCHSILPRVIEAIQLTFFYMTIFLIVVIMVLCLFSHRKKISKTWIVSCILILLVIRGGAYIIDYVTRKDVSPSVNGSDNSSVNSQSDKKEVNRDKKL